VECDAKANRQSSFSAPRINQRSTQFAYCRDKKVHAEVYKPFNDQDITPVGSAWGLEHESSGGVATAADTSPTAALHLRHRYYISLMNERK
jgi:hypothetical protein